MAVKRCPRAPDANGMAHGAKRVPTIPPGFVVGAKSVLRTVESSARTVSRVIVAADGPATMVDAVRRCARERSLTLVEVPSSAELGRHCGLPRPVAAVAQLRAWGH